MSFGKKGWQGDAPAEPLPRLVVGAAEETDTPPARDLPAEAEDGPDIAALLFPEEYAACRLVRPHAEPSCVFVPADGRWFTREYGWKSGQTPLTLEEGFEVAYPGHSVVVRGERLAEVGWHLQAHRAHILRAWRGKWEERPRGVPVIRSLTIRLDDAPEEGEG